MNKSKRTINRLFLLMIIVYTILMLIISSIACYYAYQEKKESIYSVLNQKISYMDQEYTGILENFWQIYMPAFEDNNPAKEILKNYYAFSTAEDLSPFERNALNKVLTQMRTRDSRIDWIALYSDTREINYILYNDNTSIQVINSNFPYINELSQDRSGMFILPAKTITDATGSKQTFAICGNSPNGMGSGKLIVGYSLQHFEQESTVFISGLSSVDFCLLSENQLLFDSTGIYDTSHFYLPDAPCDSVVTMNGEKYYVKAVLCGNNSTFLTYSLSYRELLKAANRDTPFILAITALFTLFAIIVHYFMNQSVKNELSVIRIGLNKMSGDNLEYCLPTDYTQEDLPEIAHKINEMNTRLNENIQKAYYFELKQKDAQLAELQATFNPHFLYNTLEMLRSKSYANGDIETSELIAQLSALFRGFINTKTFITIKEELSFCSRYLSLLIARYGDTVEVHYNIPGELLNYGIIRNVFQLFIENYFVHGFDANKTENYMKFTGRSLDEKRMLICIEDNGTGMTAAEADALNKTLQEPIRHGEKSYGLKNLNQRLKLFYGPDCGIHVSSSPETGFHVEIKLLKMHVTDYEEQKRKLYHELLHDDILL